VDLNDAIHTAECGGFIRNDDTMRPGWSIRWDAKDKLLYFFDPQGERKHRVQFSDTHRMSFQWRTTIDGN